MASELTHDEQVKNFLQSFTVGDPIRWKLHPDDIWHNGTYRGIGLQQGHVIVEVDDTMFKHRKQRFLVIDVFLTSEPPDLT